jgi:hypothetical protein
MDATQELFWKKYIRWVAKEQEKGVMNLRGKGS